MAGLKARPSLARRPPTPAAGEAEETSAEVGAGDVGVAVEVEGWGSAAGITTGVGVTLGAGVGVETGAGWGAAAAGFFLGAKRSSSASSKRPLFLAGAAEAAAFGLLDNKSSSSSSNKEDFFLAGAVVVAAGVGVGSAAGFVTAEAAAAAKRFCGRPNRAAGWAGEDVAAGLGSEDVEGEATGSSCFFLIWKIQR